MPDDRQLFMARIQPFRHMAIGYKEDFIHPGSEFFHASEPIPEKPVIIVSCGPAMSCRPDKASSTYRCFSLRHAESEPSTQAMTKSIRSFLIPAVP